MKKVFCSNCIEKYGLDPLKLGRHGDVCDKDGEIILDDYRCPNCFFKLILRPWKNQYKCQACKEVFPQKEIENNEFVKLNKKYRKIDLVKWKMQLYQKKYAKKHPEKIRERSLRQYYKDINKSRERNREYYRTHKSVKILYRKNNRDPIKKYKKKWLRKKEVKERVNSRRRERYRNDENYRNRVKQLKREYNARKKFGVRKK